MKNYCRSLKIKTSINVGVIGYPNVGKSSIINSLKRAKVCASGASAGLTKSIQTIHLDKNIKLLDSPGVIMDNTNSKNWLTMNNLLKNAVNSESLDDPITPISIIIERSNKMDIMKLYQLPYFGSCHEFLIMVARQKGRLKKVRAEHEIFYISNINLCIYFIKI